MPQLYYFHDPMCSWCWGYRPVSDKLFSNLPAEIYLVRVLGGLAPDSNEAMPEELLRAIPGYWRKIEKLLGTEFNFDFWINCQPRRSTYPACRAVIAASNQGLEVEMIDDHTVDIDTTIEYRDRIREEIDKAFEKAVEAPWPEPEEALSGVYAEEGAS